MTDELGQPLINFRCTLDECGKKVGELYATGDRLVLRYTKRQGVAFDHEQDKPILGKVDKLISNPTVDQMPAGFEHIYTLRLGCNSAVHAPNRVPRYWRGIGFRVPIVDLTSCLEKAELSGKPVVFKLTADRLVS